jgi:aspartyl protease family protein
MENSEKDAQPPAPSPPDPSKNEPDTQWNFSDFKYESEDDQANGSSFFIKFFLIAGVLTVLAIFLNHSFHVLSLREDSGQILYEGIFILIVSSSLASGNTWHKFKQLGLWAVILLVFMTGYSYRYELAQVRDRLLSEFIPTKGLQTTPNSVTFPVASDGHFYIRAQVNGVLLIFLADTGASDIVLSPDDAQRLGINLQTLRFDRIYETANGTVRGSMTTLNDFKVQGIHLQNIRASINGATMSNSLLGMTFFNRLQGYEVKEDKLTLHWEPKK